MAVTKLDRQEAAKRLFDLTSDICEPGNYLEFVATYLRDSETDWFKVYLVKENGRRQDITTDVALALSYRRGSDSRGLGLGGAGYSKTLHVAMNLYRVLNLPEVRDVSQVVQGNHPVFEWRERFSH